MDKITKFVIIIILTLLSLVFIFLSYYGITRYMYLYMASVESYAKNYQHLPKAFDNRMVITLSVNSKENAKKLKPVINSLLDQTVKVNMIALNVPYKYMKDIPEDIKYAVNIFGYSKEYTKDSAKLIPTLFREKECDTIIIAVDSDKIYGKDFIESTINSLSKTNKVILSNDKSTIAVKPEFYDCDILGRDNDNDELTTEWFLNKSKCGITTIEYSENYKCI